MKRGSLEHITDSLHEVGLLEFSSQGHLQLINTCAQKILTAWGDDSLNQDRASIEKLLGVKLCQGSASQETLWAHSKNQLLKIIHTHIPHEDGTQNCLLQLMDYTQQHEAIETRYLQDSSFAFRVRSRLTPVFNAVHLLRDFGTELDPLQSKDMLNHISHELWTLERMLDFQRDESLDQAGQLQSRMLFSTISVHTLWTRAVSNLQAMLPAIAMDAKITHTIDPELLIRADANRMTWVLEGLLHNALVYGEGIRTIHLEAKADDYLVQLNLYDQGISIPPEERGQIFNEGFRASNAQSYSLGEGRTLWFARKLLLKMGGALYYQDVQPGSCFNMEIPSP